MIIKSCSLCVSLCVSLYYPSLPAVLPNYILARPCVRVHRRTSIISSSLLLNKWIEQKEDYLESKNKSQEQWIEMWKEHFKIWLETPLKSLTPNLNNNKLSAFDVNAILFRNELGDSCSNPGRVFTFLFSILFSKKKQGFISPLLRNIELGSHPARTGEIG